MIRRVIGCALVLGVLGTASASAQSVPDSLPPGVTADMISQGQTLFGGVGLCMACHGPTGTGVPGMGPDLTDTEWIHHEGSYEDLVDQILNGIPADKSTNGIVMPPKGGSAITDEQVRQVAAYVWAMSRGD